MPHSAFIIRPFGRKPYAVPPDRSARIERLLQQQEQAPTADARLLLPRGSEGPAVEIDFDVLDDRLIRPALRQAGFRGETTGAVIEAGNIREDMFNRLITADLVVADVSLHNPNVYYELGLRQAFRDKFTFVLRADLDAYPFDLQTDRYFAYTLEDLVARPASVVEALALALRRTVNQYRADSPVFKLLPQLEAEDRSRFLSVPDDFLEEVERARQLRERDYLSLLALECEGHLWETEGLRVVGRAQFEANFIDGAKHTWQRIAAHYPDDVEANTVLSTVYQRLSDRTRSEQALARASRTRALTPARQSDLRALAGRNLKAAWREHWSAAGPSSDGRACAALSSPLLQQALDAYTEAFKRDMNNSYAGLNALALAVIQAELIDRHPDDWRALQRRPEDAGQGIEQRHWRIDQLALALELAVESDRDRLAPDSPGDPWFSMLEAALACLTSWQPRHVAQLYAKAKHDAPQRSDEGMRHSLEMYQDLDIQGRSDPDAPGPRRVGSIGLNVGQALQLFERCARERRHDAAPARILVFVGMRLDETASAHGPADAGPAADAGSAGGEASGGAGAPRALFPRDQVDAVRELLGRVIDEELGDERNVLAIAGGAAGGDLLFHELCAERRLGAQMFIATPRPQHIGQYVAPAGNEWVEAYARVHERLRGPGNPARRLLEPGGGIEVFSDGTELPRWLRDQPCYNVGRRSMLWMLQHAHTLSQTLGDRVPITLIALRVPRESPGAFGGIDHSIRLAQMHGIKARIVDLR